MCTETNALPPSPSSWRMNVSTLRIEKARLNACKIYSFFQCLGIGCRGVVWSLKSDDGKMQAIKLNYSPLTIKEEFNIPFSWPNYTVGLSLHPKGFIPSAAPYIPEMIVMPKYDGTLKNYLTKLSIRERLDAICQISTGLKTLHALGLFHNDLNLSNIAYHIENKRFDIIDFGKTERDASLMDNDVRELKNILVSILMGDENVLLTFEKLGVSEASLCDAGFNPEICPLIMRTLETLPDTAVEISFVFSALQSRLLH